MSDGIPVVDALVAADALERPQATVVTGDLRDLGELTAEHPEVGLRRVG